MDNYKPLQKHKSDLDSDSIRSENRVPVEVWHKILRTAIWFPLLPQEDDGYLSHKRLLPFDCALIAEYKASERIRTNLRLVCRSWDRFLDEYSDRLVHLNKSVPDGHWPPIKRWNYVVRIHCSKDLRCSCKPDPCWPCSQIHKRASRWDPTTMPSLRIMIENVKNLYLPLLGNRLKVIVDANVWIDQLLDRDRLGGVISLTGVGEAVLCAPFSQEISKAYQDLTHLGISIRDIYSLENYFDLPKLRSLSLTFSGRAHPSSEASLGHWHLPSLRILVVKLFNDGRHDIRPTFDLFVPLVGGALKHFIFEEITNHYLPTQSVLSDDLWTSMPKLELLGIQLKELASLSKPADMQSMDLVINVEDSFSERNDISSYKHTLRQNWTHAISGQVILDRSWQEIQNKINKKTSRWGRNLSICAEIFDFLDVVGIGLQDSEGIRYDEHQRAEIHAAILESYNVI